ncbi:MAG: putative bifunctional diguanylate cyclase/phosphodiesterase [Burkholderiaceae bacterium]
MFPAEITYSSFDDLGQIVVLAQVRDLTERKQAEEERLRLVTSDLLTGLPNRQHLEFKLRELLAHSEAQGQRCALLLIDIAHFKKINDALGHLKGDEVLREISQLLAGCCQGCDLLARVGGDEFVMVMSGLTGRESVLTVEDRARQVLAQLQREVRQGGLGVTMGASIGIAFSQPQGSSPQALLQHAELALYEAKAHGRGEWRFFSDDMDARLAASLRLESALRSALADGSEELQLHYQPICDARTGALVKVEALLRWNSPTLGPVSPDRFIPIAEQSALILDLGHWVMNEAMRQVAAWRAAHGHAPVVSVNVSVRQFLHKDFELQLYSLLLLHDLPASQIELELTESVLAGEDDELQGLLTRLRDTGCGLSLDDFGTGYSSLSYLARFRLSSVKIDRSFVRGVDQDMRKRSLVRAIVSMGHSLGLVVVAEGVETEAERGVLLQEGCDQLQGYLLGRPAPAQDQPPSPAAVP